MLVTHSSLRQFVKFAGQYKTYFVWVLILLLGITVLTFFPNKISSQSPTEITVSSRISTSTDDAEERVSSGAVGLTSSDLEFGAEGGGTKLQLVGMRFNNLAIPVGALITNAYIEYEVDEIDSEVTNLIIRGQDADNPPTFTDQVLNVSSRTTTSSFVSWNDVPPWTIVSEKKITPNLSDIVQEIVNRSGWAPGNSMVIVVEGTGERTAESYDGESVNAPLLVVTYIPSGAPTPTPTLIPTPTPTPVEGTIKLAVIGDYGSGNTDEAQVANLVNSWNPDHVLTTGDNNYPDGEAVTIDENIGQFYSQYIGNYQGTFGLGSPINRFWPSLGNHDWHTITCDLFGCNGAYFDYFTLPNNERYYDVDLGIVHLFAIDSDSDEPDGRDDNSIQANWLQTKLSTSDSCYNLVYFHHSAYSSGRHGSKSYMQWPFASWGADAVFGGHDHLYERIDVSGTPYFVNGAGGKGLYTFDNIGNLPPEATSVVRYNEDYGAMLVILTPSDITYQFYNKAGDLIDNYVVPKDCDAPLPTPTPTPTPTISPSPTPTPTPTLIEPLVFTPSDDALVNAKSPNTNYGFLDSLEIDNRPVKTFFLKFAVSGIGMKQVENAVVRLYNFNSSPQGGDLRFVPDNSWSEMTLTWNGAPTTVEPIISSLGRVAKRKWYEFTVTPIITGDGTYSMSVSSTSSNDADYYSKEGPSGLNPVLEITVSP